MNDSAPRHPEAQTMAAFLEGKLPPEQIRDVADHLRGCVDCRTVLTETARFEREEERLPESRPGRSWTSWLAVAAVLALVAVSAPLLLQRAASRRSPIAHLIDKAPREHRYVEARLSGFPWARLQAQTRGTAPRDPDDLKLDGAAGDVLAKTDQRRDAESRHAAGVAHLLIGERSQSIAALEQAARESNDAKVWNDLAAALYATAVEEDNRHELFAPALAAADHALRLNPRNADALFNRALIVEHIGVPEAARKAWQRYLDVDPNSAWSAEARKHLHDLGTPSSRRFDPTAPNVREFPNEAREWGEVTLLGDWADAVISGDDARAAHVLARVRQVANELAAFNGEHLLDDAVAVAERSTGATRAALAAAHRQYRDACAIRKRWPETAEPQFRQAAERFAIVGSAMAGAAGDLAATAAFDQSRDVHDELTRLAARVDGKRHRNLFAQIQRHLALNANRAGDWGAGVRYADAAAATFRALGERTNAAIADEIAAYALEVIGARDEAWRRRLRALRVDCEDGPVSCNAALGDIGTTLVAVGQTDAALSISNLFADDGAADPANAALSLVKRAKVREYAGDAEGAARLLAEARHAAARMPYPKRYLPEAQIAIEEGALLSRRDPAAATATLDRAASFFTDRRFRYVLPYLYLQRARAQRAAGNDDAAALDYGAALRAAVDQQSAIDDMSLRLTFFDTAAEAADEAIELELSRGATARAFEIADRRHDAFASAVPPLDHNAALVEYVMLPKSLAIFCITNGRITEETVAIERRALAEQIDAFAAEIRRRAPSDDIRHDGNALFRLLISPLQPHLGGVHELIIVPDRQLHAVPFAALFDGKRFLVEDYVLCIAPSAAARPALKTTALQPALVVADPHASAGVPALRAGREEAMHIAEIYRAVVLAGDDATAERFAAVAANSALIHYTGHANSDDTTSFGALLLAGRVMSASEVGHLSLKQGPLVILAACGTFRGDPAHVAGMSSLARAFLVAGARGVVGTLWEIDDDVSAQLFLRFHEVLRAGASPADALRDAQLYMLRSPKGRLAHPATWSPVELLQSSL